MAKLHVTLRFRDPTEHSYVGKPYEFVVAKPGPRGVHDLEELTDQFLSHPLRKLVVLSFTGSQSGIDITAEAIPSLKQLTVYHHVRSMFFGAGYRIDKHPRN